jgi:predicted nucleotidyltransferase
MRQAAQQTHQAERSFHLYALRPLLATLWVEQGRGVAPIRFSDLVDALVVL